jgi:hypothetical protein
MWRSIGSVLSSNKNAGVIAETAKMVGTLSLLATLNVTDSAPM